MTLSAGQTMRQAREEIAAVLKTAGIEAPKREARLLIAMALKLSLTDLVMSETEALGTRAGVLDEWLARRLTREPLSRIAGEREFFGLKLALGRATLDPRPDTETLVEAALEKAAAAARILDLGTGSGAVLLALLSRLPEASGLGIDIAEEAVASARANAHALGLGARAEFRAGDLFAGIDGSFDVIVSNPPYIPSAEIAGLDAEVRLYDPLLALDGGADGLDFYRRIAQEAPRFLAPGGVLALEVGAGQAGAVGALLAAAGLREGFTRHDLAGIERVVAAFMG